MANDVMIVSCETFYNDSDIKDSVFRDEMDAWMARYMPSMPLGLLSDDPEHWEVERVARFFVDNEQEFTFYECTGCHERFAADEAEEAPTCAFCTKLCDEGESPPVVERLTVEGFAVWDRSEGRFVPPENVITREDEAVPRAEGDVAVFVLEREADRECEEQETRAREEDGEESGVPWMHNWFFFPDRYVSTGTLQRAGFTVAWYSGGTGGPVRLAGVNGVGYSHEISHYTKLYVLHHYERGIYMQTSLGRVFVFPRDASSQEIERAAKAANL